MRATSIVRFDVSDQNPFRVSRSNFCNDAKSVMRGSSRIASRPRSKSCRLPTAAVTSFKFSDVSSNFPAQNRSRNCSMARLFRANRFSSRSSALIQNNCRLRINSTKPSWSVDPSDHAANHWRNWLIKRQALSSNDSIRAGSNCNFVPLSVRFEGQSDPHPGRLCRLKKF